VKHEAAEDCPCSPTPVPVEREDASIGWVYAHHGEKQEPRMQAERAARIFEAMALVKEEK